MELNFKKNDLLNFWTDIIGELDSRILNGKYIQMI